MVKKQLAASSNLDYSLGDKNKIDCGALVDDIDKILVTEPNPIEDDTSINISEQPIQTNKDESLATLETFSNYKDYVKWFNISELAKEPFSELDFLHSIRFKKYK